MPRDTSSAPHDAVRDVLSHLVVQNGVTDAAAVETRLTAGNGGTFDADLVFFDPSTSSAPPHDAVRDVLSYLVVQNGVTDAAAV